MAGAAVGIALSLLTPAEPRERALADAIAVAPGATCLTHAAIVAAVGAWLGRDEVDARLSITVEGDPDDERVVEFEVFKAGAVRSRREFRPGPAGCKDLRGVVSLALALAVDAALLESLRPSDENVPPAAESAEAPRAEQQPDADPSPAPETRRAEPRPTTRVGLGLEPLGFAGVVPRGGFGGALFVELWWAPRLSFRVGPFVAQTFGVPIPPSSGRADTTLIAGRTDVCVTGESRRIRAGGCTGVAAGVVRALATDLSDSRPVMTAWAASSLGAIVRIALGPRIALAIDADIWLSFVRPTLRVRDEDGAVSARRDFPIVGGSVGVGPVFVLK